MMQLLSTTELTEVHMSTGLHVAHLRALLVRHEYEYCDVCVNRSDDNMLDDCMM